MLLAGLAVLNLIISCQPCGIVYSFGLWGAKIAQASSLFDPSVNAFWSQPSNATALQQSVFLDTTTITSLGILAGALLIFAGKKDDKQQRLNRTQWIVGIAAGFLLGYSSRLAFGCNVGAMVSGISTGSLHAGSGLPWRSSVHWRVFASASITGIKRWHSLKQHAS